MLTVHSHLADVPIQRTAPASCVVQARSSTSFGVLWRHRDLIRQLTRREVIGRYKGSVLGVLWSLVNPLLILAVYTFAFAYILKIAPRGPVGGREGRAALWISRFLFFREWCYLAC